MVFSKSERKRYDTVSVLTLFFFPSSLGSLELETHKITVWVYIYSAETQKQWEKVSETSCWWQCTTEWKKQAKKKKTQTKTKHKKDVEWRWHEKFTVTVESSM